MSSLPRPCIEQGCPNVVTEGSRCPACLKEFMKRDVQRRGSAAARGYDAEWVRVRDEYAREHPLCEDCLAEGVTTAMQLVDHVVPLPVGARLDKANLRSMCRQHHAVKTIRDQQQGAVANIAPAPVAQEGPTRWIA